MKKFKKKRGSATARPRLEKIPWVFPRLPRRRTRSGPEIEPAELPYPPKIPKTAFSFPPRAYSSDPFLKSLDPRPYPGKTPKTFRIRRFFRAIFKVEPDKPKRMPHFPTLSFPPLYSRYAIMKTYTAVTDLNGQVTVTFPRVFRKIPGVVLTPQADVTWFPIVLSKNEFGFTAKILKTIHSHQHADSGGGGQHSHGGSSDWGGDHGHVIYTGGEHSHSVSGYLTLNLYRALAYTSLAVIGDGDHTHSNPGTSSDGSHTHGTNIPTSYDDGTGIHNHSVHGTTGSDGTHSHSQGATGSDGYHTHSLSAGSNNFVYDADITIGAWTSDQHEGHPHGEDNAGNHDHVIIVELAHQHTVPDSNEKGASFLANTSVTFTYFAQEETD